MKELIIYVLEELQLIKYSIDNQCYHKAYAAYLDFVGDVSRLNDTDKAAALALLAEATGKLIPDHTSKSFINKICNKCPLWHNGTCHNTWTSPYGNPCLLEH